jgi:hypothetical protein
MRAPWIWSRSIDLGVFAGSAAVALVLAGLSPWLAGEGVPTWAWFAFVLGLDVAHVWSTLFRTYLDPAEVRKRRLLYLGLPVLCYAAGVALHWQGALTFWRVLAYVAAFHFVRQQVGWVAIYRVRNGEHARLDRLLDAAVIYAATGFPLFYWHTHLPRRFSWFVAGDFLDLSALSPLVAPLGAVYGLLLSAYAARAVQQARRGKGFNLGKHVVVATTASIWLVGIVAYDDDFAFTVTNVTVHAVPYFALLWFYARERAAEAPRSTIARIVGYGFAAFATVALALAFCEELLWERLVWHDRPGWFGGPERDAPLLGETALALVVPLLALPQLVHYALDGVLWRSRDAGPAQARALGFAPSAVSSAPAPATP